MFHRHLHYSITLNIPAYFEPQGIQFSWFGVKESNSENVDSLLDPLTFTQKQLGDICSCLLVLLNQTAAFPLRSFTRRCFGIPDSNWLLGHWWTFYCSRKCLHFNRLSDTTSAVYNGG